MAPIHLHDYRRLRTKKLISIDLEKVVVILPKLANRGQRVPSYADGGGHLSTVRQSIGIVGLESKPYHNVYTTAVYHAAVKQLRYIPQSYSEMTAVIHLQYCNIVV